MWRLTLFLLVLLVGCEGADPVLVVQLVSDYAPGLEVASARTVVSSDVAGADALREAIEDLTTRAALVDATRIAEVAIPAGHRYVVEVTLFDAGGARVASRRVALRFDGNAAVTVVMTRSCRDVTCPSAGDATATGCLGGRCVSPECTPEHPEACPAPECVGGGDCPAGAAACVEPVCLSGTCGLRADDARCAEGARCHPEDGCEAAAEPDAGPPDAGPPDAGPQDAGLPDAGPGVACASVCPGTCEGEVCVLVDLDMPVCPDGVACRVRCTLSGCIEGVFCGDGPCEVECGFEGCRGGVDCGPASACDVTCANLSSCPIVRCGSGACDLHCLGDRTCTTVDCGDATQCVVDCAGADSCATVQCGGDCSVTCADAADCGIVDCTTACACDVSCPSCASPPSCPSGCDTSTGCTSTAAGCDACAG